MFVNLAAVAGPVVGKPDAMMDVNYKGGFSVCVWSFFVIWAFVVVSVGFVLILMSRDVAVAVSLQNNQSIAPVFISYLDIILAHICFLHFTAPMAAALACQHLGFGHWVQSSTQATNAERAGQVLYVVNAVCFRL